MLAGFRPTVDISFDFICFNKQNIFIESWLNALVTFAMLIVFQSALTFHLSLSILTSKIYLPNDIEHLLAGFQTTVVPHVIPTVGLSPLYTRVSRKQAAQIYSLFYFRRKWLFVKQRINICY